MKARKVQSQQIEIHYTWSTILRSLFKVPGVTVIGGPGKSGKTNLALKIAEDSTKIPALNANRTNNLNSTLIEEVASNIDTFGFYPQISDLISIRQWLFANNHRKLFITDEVTEHFSNKRVMSGQNVGFMRLLPQATKAHARMIVIGHNILRIDATLLDEAWCKAIFIKSELKTAQLFSGLFPKPFEFHNISPTSIKYDPYAIAPFTEKPAGKVYFKDTDKQILWEWSHGKSIRDLDIHNMQLNRLARKYIRENLENDFHFSHTSLGGL